VLSDFAKIIVPPSSTARRRRDVRRLGGQPQADRRRHRRPRRRAGAAHRQDAERDAETRKKEALLEAKEKAHDILMEAERQARQDAAGGDARADAGAPRVGAAERQAAIDRLEKELAARDQALRLREQTAAAAAAKYEELVAQQKHELERVAGLTADEAKELLIKQIEGEARHDSANLLSVSTPRRARPRSTAPSSTFTEAIQALRRRARD
jgi:ribonuclease Y